jgi:hypothetical protein
MIISIIWAAFAGWRQNRANVVAATAFVIPFGLFFPIQSTGDFFGQWNNIFMWSAIALAPCRSQNLGSAANLNSPSPDYPRPIKGIFGAITVMN